MNNRQESKILISRILILMALMGVLQLIHALNQYPPSIVPEFKKQTAIARIELLRINNNVERLAK